VPTPRLRSASAIALAAAAVALAVPTAAGAATALPDLPAVPAAPAAELRDSVGVNVHLSYASTPYNNFPAVKSALLELGVRHVRDGACAGCTWLFPRMLDLGASGIRFTLIAGSPRNTTGTLPNNLAAIRDKLRGAVTAVEGVNEYDISGDADWAPKVRAFQADLYSRVQADPGLRGLDVIGPSLVWPASRTTLGDLSASMTYGNLHSYPGGQTPARNLGSELPLAAKVSAAKPVVATETGYHNALAVTGTHAPADEVTAGVYTERLPLDYFRRGIRRAFLYELIDQKPELGKTNMQMHFGLLRNDLSRKPAFTALKALLATVGDGKPATPRSLRYDLTGGDASLRQQLFARADGSFSLALWRDVSMWDTKTRTQIAVTPTPVTVRLGQPATSATVLRRGATISSVSAPTQVKVNLGVSPVVVRILGA
jgi:hypothetical protein